MRPYSIKPHQKIEGPLSGQQILLTRAGDDNDALAKKLRKRGAVVLIFPCLQIEISPPPRRWEQQLLAIKKVHGIIFTSRYAVRSIQNNWPETLRQAPHYAIGLATAAEMRAANLPSPFTAEPQTSEGLLNHPNLQIIAKETWLIIGGENPREHLQLTLEKRGAQVHRVACYRRICPSYSDQTIARLEKEGINRIIVQSTDCLKNIAHLLQPMPTHSFWGTELLLPTERYVEIATKLGFYGKLRVVGSTADEEILLTLGM
jgi:uroporphyrinogen-III synthase